VGKIFPYNAIPLRMKVIAEKTQCWKELRIQVLQGHNFLVPLEFQFLRLRANFGVYFMLWAYIDMLSLYFV